MKRRAIVFDMDGLMVDTEPLSRRAWDLVLQPFGCAFTDEEYHPLVGRRIDVTTQRILELFDLPLTADDLIAQKSAMMSRLRADGVPVMPGLMPLQAAIAQRGLPWAVATSSSRDHAEEILAQLGLLDACHAIAAGNEVVHGKPAPDIYLLAASRLNIEPHACMALEDSLPGCRAAVAAGMLGVAVPSGESQTADFSFAHYVLPSLHEVLDRLDELLAAST